MELRTFIIVDDEVYEAVITEVGTDDTVIPFARTFKLYRGGEEVAIDALSAEAASAIYDKLDDKVAESWISPDEAEWRARRSKFFKQ